MNLRSRGSVDIMVAIIGAIASIAVGWLSAGHASTTKVEERLSARSDQIHALSEKVSALEKRTANVAGKLDLPVGSIIFLAGRELPSDFGSWLPCSGEVLLAKDYPELARALGTTFGRSDVQSSFRLPNMSGRVPIGAGEYDDLPRAILSDV